MGGSKEREKRKQKIAKRRAEERAGITARVPSAQEMYEAKRDHRLAFQAILASCPLLPQDPLEAAQRTGYTLALEAESEEVGPIILPDSVHAEVEKASGVDDQTVTRVRFSFEAVAIHLTGADVVFGIPGATVAGPAYKRPRPVTRETIAELTGFMREIAARLDSVIVILKPESK